jgi:hypothetical protein
MYSKWYIFVRIMSAGSRHNTHKNIPFAVHTVPPYDELKRARNM